MDYFDVKNGEAYCESLPLTQLAHEHGTPLYVYSHATLKRHCQRLIEAFASYPTLACFAVKANSNLSYLKAVFAEGLGADLVSNGELQRSLMAGVDPQKIVYSGVGKTDAESRAGIDAGILCFNIESQFELDRIHTIAKEKNTVAPIVLRINPNIDAKTHPKISTGLHSTKFGIAEDTAETMFPLIRNMSHVKLCGLACHIGSQMTELKPLREASQRVVRMASQLQEMGFDLRLINMGGGLGIRYRDESPPELEAYAQCLIDAVSGTGLQLIVEPGRVIAGNTGVLLTKVLGVKTTPQKTFAVVDASMTEIVRPAFYDSYHEICPVIPSREAQPISYDIVGPVCESSDILGRERMLPELEANDLLFLRGCGAYGACMASNYNSRPRPAEVMVDGDDVTVIRKREPLERLWDLERL